MPTKGLSLVGFMDQQQAINYLRSACVPQPANASDAQLAAVWTAAKQALGAPIANAGQPDIQPIPGTHQSRITHLMQEPWVQMKLAPYGANVDFKFVEIAPLLAYQHHVCTERSSHHTGTLTSVPTLDQLFDTCLPAAQPVEPFNRSNVTPTTSGIVIKTPSHNLRIEEHGLFEPVTPIGKIHIVGARFAVSLPFVHVVRLNGKCLLHNGYHRAWGLMRAGATHVPCLFRDVPDAQSAGVMTDGSTFGETLLFSADPPTLAHYGLPGRACDVQLRRTSTIIHASWHTYSMPDE